MYLSERELIVDNVAPNAYTTTMNTETIEIKAGETAAVDGLKITNLGGGHKIVSDHNGQRGGDLSYAEVEFKTPNKQEKFFLMDDKKLTKPLVFDGYLITTQVIEWNGRSVTLAVSVLPEESIMVMKRYETKVIGNMSITYTSDGHITEDNEEKVPYITLEIATPSKNSEDLYKENQSFALAGNAIRIISIDVEKGTAELGVLNDIY